MSAKDRGGGKAATAYVEAVIEMTHLLMIGACLGYCIQSGAHERV